MTITDFRCLKNFPTLLETAKQGKVLLWNSKEDKPQDLRGVHKIRIAELARNGYNVYAVLETDTMLTHYGMLELTDYLLLPADNSDLAYYLHNTNMPDTECSAISDSIEINTGYHSTTQIFITEENGILKRTHSAIYFEGSIL
jgi:hypothetical protein